MPKKDLLKSKKLKLPKKISQAIDEYVQALLKEYKKDIEKIILFGSYARGDQRKYSDVDLLIMTDLPEKKARILTPFWTKTVYLADDIAYKYDYCVDISPTVITQDYLKKYYSPLMDNAREEGITLWKRK